MLNPVSPCPIFALDDGRFLLMLQNHDGHGYGGRGPRDFHARRPQFIAVGEFRPDAHQPIWFSQPQLLFDTQNIGVFPFFMKWLSMYASVTEHRGERILWYADRKIFGLGRYITDEAAGPADGALGIAAGYGKALLRLSGPSPARHAGAPEIEHRSMAIEVRPVSSALGAEVIGADLSRPDDDEQFKIIHKALLDNNVVVIRDQQISPADHAAFSARFGKLELHVLNQFLLPEQPEVLVLSNKQVNGSTRRAARRGPRVA